MTTMLAQRVGLIAIGYVFVARKTTTMCRFLLYHRKDHFLFLPPASHVATLLLVHVMETAREESAMTTDTSVVAFVQRSYLPTVHAVVDSTLTCCLVWVKTVSIPEQKIEGHAPCLEMCQCFRWALDVFLS